MSVSKASHATREREKERLPRFKVSKSSFYPTAAHSDVARASAVAAATTAPATTWLLLPLILLLLMLLTT